MDCDIQNQGQPTCETFDQTAIIAPTLYSHAADLASGSLRLFIKLIDMHIRDYVLLDTLQALPLKFDHSKPLLN